MSGKSLGFELLAKFSFWSKTKRMKVRKTAVEGPAVAL